jgi:hypothetical protein
MVRFSREKHGKHIDTKLRNRLRLYAVLTVGLVGIVIFEILAGFLPLLLAVIGLGIGTIFGLVSSRMYHLSWDHDARKVVSRMDVFGIIILVVYFLSAMLRRMVIGYFVHGPAVWGVTFAIATGIMFGRVFGMRGRIIQVLKEQNVF